MPQYSHILKAGRRYREERRPLVLATVVATAGSTYRKTGAAMLLDESGPVAGLLSGGCLEGDLLLHANEVLATGLPRLIEYDLRTDHELIWGPGTGCEGASTIFLRRLSEADEYGPLAIIERAREANATVRIATVLVSDEDLEIRPGAFCWWGGSDAGAGGSAGIPDELARALRAQADTGKLSGSAELARHTFNGGAISFFVQEIVPPPQALILGAGPDASPVARLALEQGWRVQVVDHRPRYLESARFPSGVDTLLCRPAQLVGEMDLDEVAAAIVMSHHFESDAEYLRLLLESSVGYVGLLGPTRRRDRLLEHIGVRESSELSNKSMKVDERLRAPIGLDLGGALPESIALAIVAEVQAYLAGRNAHSLRTKTRSESVGAS